MQHFVLYCPQYIQNKEIAQVPSWSIFLPFPYWNLGRRFPCSVPISFSHRGQGEPSSHLCHFTRSKGGTRGSSSAGGYETLQSSWVVSWLRRKKEWITKQKAWCWFTLIFPWFVFEEKIFYPIKYAELWNHNMVGVGRCLQRSPGLDLK